MTIIDLNCLEILPKAQFNFIVLNCFATPYLQQPIKWSAFSDSATKLMDGQGGIGRNNRW
jgi:O-succinylhomoserine sulfhydrylase